MNKKSFLIVGVLAVGMALPSAAFAATLSLSPPSASVATGQSTTLNVFVSSPDQAMNAVSGTVSFPSDTLEVVSISKNNSIVTLWAQEPSFSNAAGTVSFEGVVPNPGFTGASGKIVSITFRAKSQGSAKLSFASGSVLANDGQGTELFTGSGGATVSIQSSPQPQNNLPAPSVESAAPVSNGNGVAIRSSTHPDQARWYNNNSPSFTWDLPVGALEVRTIISENSKAAPNIRYTIPISSKIVENLPDGTYYFFVQVKTNDGWGAVSRYQVNVDTTPPDKFRITFPHGSVSFDPQPIVLFSTIDNASGIDHYEVKVGARGPLQTAAPAESNPYTLPLQDPGLHKVAVSAFDRAGNVASAETDFTIESIETPKIVSYPEEMTIGDILRIRGATYPNATVDITVSQDDKPVATETTKSNSLGDFGIVVSKRLWPGTYAFTARVTDDRGARSPETTPYTVKVRLQFFTDALTFIINYFFIALSIIIGIAIIAAVGIWSWFKLLRLTRTMKKETDEVQTVVHRSFEVMKTGVEKHIKDLHKARGARTLTNEELEFLEQFKDTLSEAEDVISRRVDKIPTREK